MILGPDGQTPLTTEQQVDAEQARRKDLCDKVYTLFAHESVTYVEGADVAANLLVNLVKNQPDFAEAQNAARQVIGNLTQVFQIILRETLQHERARRVLQAANQQHAPS